METTKADGLKKISSLVERFRLHQDSYHASGYNETQVRREFIDPFWKALGWDIDNEGGALDAYKDVVHEDRVRVDGSMKAPDYCFKIYNDRKFYVEAKKPGIDIKSDTNPAYQIRSYGWNRKLAVSIVTDFEEFAVYDCGKKPKKDDKTAVGRLCYYTFENYVTQFDFFWENFSKEAAVTGRFDKFARSSSRAKSGDTVDKEFLKSMDAWRVDLAKNIAVNNEHLSEEDVNHAVQLIIDRILFLRICEGREVEPNGNLTFYAGKEKCYQGLLKYFSQADDKYNSGIFDFAKDTLTQKITIEDIVIKNILKELYEGDYNFEAIPVEILGNVYEQFLGKVIRLTVPGHHAKVEEKPEVRKAGGVYYTPQYIVDYIVKNTVGKLVEGKTPAEAAKLRICDPACGSGSFLLGAYQYLLDWHLDWYLKNPVKEEPASTSKKAKGKQQESPLTPNGRLSTSEKKRILLNNIYGVDIDGQAVEVTKLSLLLKALEGETEASINTQLELFHERVLPSLEENIRCGNSLIGPDYFSGQLAPDAEELKRVNPFDWRASFPEVFKNGGFDVVIGNPPYGITYSQNELGYLSSLFPQISKFPDSYCIFMAMVIKITNHEGLCSLIVPNTFCDLENCDLFREWLLHNYYLYQIWQSGWAFQKAVVDTIVFTLIKKLADAKSMIAIQIGDKRYERLITDFDNNLFKIDYRNLPGSKELLTRVFKKAITLGEIATIKAGVKIYEKGKGIPPQTEQTLKERPFTRTNGSHKDWKKLFRGENVGRYSLIHSNEYINYGPWLAAPRTSDLFESPKILMRRTDDRLLSCIELESAICVNSCHVIKLKDYNYEQYHYLLGILNSRLLQHIFEVLNPQMVGKVFAEIKVIYVERLPINISNLKAKDEIINLVVSMLELHKRLNTTDSATEREALQRLIDDTDRKIDALVYELYGLTEEEIKIVEGEK